MVSSLCVLFSGQRFPQAGQTVVVHYTGIYSTLKVYFDMASTG